MNHEAVAQALAELAGAVTGIERANAFVPDVIVPPNFYVGEVTELYDQTYGGLSDAIFLCRVMVGHASDEDAQRLLRTFKRRTGPTSIKAALEGTPGTQQTLGGLCDDLHVQKFQGHRMYTVNDKKYYGGEWVVRVIGFADDDEE